MTNYTIWADRGTGASDIYKIGEYLQQCAGGSVKVLGIGPSVGQNYGLSGGKGTTGVFMTNGVGIATPNDFEMGISQGYYHYDHAIFVWPQWIGNQYMSDENIKSHIIPGEWDWNRSSSYNVGGQTAAQWFPNAKHVDLVAGQTPEEVAKKICNGNYVGGSGNTSSSSSSSSSNGTQQSNVSPLLSGDMTFEELVGEICNGIDLMFLCKRSTVVVTDFETIFAEAKYLRDNHKDAVAAEDVKLWQLEEDSYELEVNQHGFYNTVIVNYKNGTVRESFDDFVRVYGEVPITYDEPTIDKTTAIMKAKAYLAAHLRDLEMTVNVTMSVDGDIDIGDIVTIENPKTLKDKNKILQNIDPEYLFVKGVSTNWDDDYIQTDLECQFSPTSPKKLEVPTAGSGGTSQSSSNTETSGSFNHCGVSSDGTQVMAIGLPSASGESSSYGYNFYKSVFVNKCAFCNKPTLIWAWNWGSGPVPCKGTTEGGTTEGHIFCTNCDADFSCIDGKDHMSPPRATLTRVSGPTASSREEAEQLKSGKMS